MVLSFSIPSIPQRSRTRCDSRLAPLSDRSDSGTPKNGERVSSLQFPSITLQNMSDGTTSGVQSVGSAMYLHPNKSNVVVYLTAHDKRQVKLMEMLASESRTTSSAMSLAILEAF